MNEILTELLKGSTVILETEKLTDFWAYCMTQKNLYAFRYDYQETTVKITISKETNIRQ
jgi:hypothetical protein